MALSDKCMVVFVEHHAVAVHPVAEQAVADGDPDEVHGVGLVVLDDVRGERRGVDAAVTLRRHEQLVVAERGELDEEVLESGVVLFHREVVAGVAVGRLAVRETHARGRLQVDDVGERGPGKWVGLEGEVVLDFERAMFSQEAVQRGAARASVEPQKKGAIRGTVLGLHEPVVQPAAAAAVQVAAVLQKLPLELRRQPGELRDQVCRSGGFWNLLRVQGSSSGGSWDLFRVQGSGSGGFWNILRVQGNSSGGSWDLFRVQGSGSGGFWNILRVQGSSFEGFWKFLRVQGSG